MSNNKFKIGIVGKRNNIDDKLIKELLSKGIDVHVIDSNIPLEIVNKPKTLNIEPINFKHNGK